MFLVQEKVFKVAVKAKEVNVSFTVIYCATQFQKLAGERLIGPVCVRAVYSDNSQNRRITG